MGPAAIVRFIFIGEQEFADGKKTPQNLAMLTNWHKQGSDWKLPSRSATKLRPAPRTPLGLPDPGHVPERP